MPERPDIIDSPLDELKSRYLVDQDGLTTYRRTRNLFYISVLTTIFLTVPAYIAAITSGLLIFGQVPFSKIAQDTNLILITLAGYAMIPVIYSTYRLGKKRNKLMAEGNKPITNLVAKMVDAYDKEDYDSVRENANKLKKKLRFFEIIDPNHQKQLRSYLDKILEMEGSEFEDEVDESFNKVFSIVAMDILLELQPISPFIPENGKDNESEGYIEIIKDALGVSKVKDSLLRDSITYYWAPVSIVVALGLSIHIFYSKDLGIYVTAGLIALYSAYYEWKD